VELDLLLDENGGRKQKKKQLGEYLDFIHGADLLIADGQYSESEYPSKKGWGYTFVPVLMALAQEAEVKQVAVFHHDPQHSDAFLDELWRGHRKDEETTGGMITVFWAREGMTVAV
jgi:phosphoribosyl 1,2-cyclic phosphodiesterase